MYVGTNKSTTENKFRNHTFYTQHGKRHPNNDLIETSTSTRFLVFGSKKVLSSTLIPLLFIFVLLEKLNTRDVVICQLYVRPKSFPFNAKQHSILNQPTNNFSFCIFTCFLSQCDSRTGYNSFPLAVKISLRRKNKFFVVLQ